MDILKIYCDTYWSLKFRIHPMYYKFVDICGHFLLRPSICIKYGMNELLTIYRAILRQEIGIFRVRDPHLNIYSLQPFVIKFKLISKDPPHVFSRL